MAGADLEGLFLPRPILLLDDRSPKTSRTAATSLLSFNPALQRHRSTTGHFTQRISAEPVEHSVKTCGKQDRNVPAKRDMNVRRPNAGWYSHDASGARMGGVD
ncbi:hypothetical protein AAFF_G00048040 [Aldrovandia affinis]|uniref:Uncharacterized protein n=1 Tax=Aldrovandia affinis TaxID=143900 RepID=A0AAD7S3U1_9TELE|nr:hypothetical protein AAFF_G00048040 [Aldrovandia affinis]